MPTKSEDTEVRRSLTHPGNVALSGVVFAVLFLTSLLIIRLAIPADPGDPGVWLINANSKAWVQFSLQLLPFTGIAFLWFMGVLRDHIGELEDRFFATVFLGSGFLFVGMLFTCAATAQGLLGVFGERGGSLHESETYMVGRRIVYSLLTTFAFKMAAIFMSVASVIGKKTSIFPPWLTRLGTCFAVLILLLVSSYSWLSLLFPVWVLVVSIWILARDFSRPNDS
ncbi:hypothetical protein VN12_09990 [Pirellula sp. SH-Sr6A]|uniref:hypothetical protein n=1 Tax=Pirellula sp. SH-Sr6A TaxID=1632865 RepID=UPI00078B5F77|nr:hypothetical protein [Pirellula sp. SH-Sr6A]AMV32444.1 hypothetical protein VN12_09990 [Pirellula sp. SH-Sr6A]